MNREIETELCHLGEGGDDFLGAVVPPLFQNSLFTFKNWDDIDAAFDERFGRSIYTRLSNPTTVLAEQKIAEHTEQDCQKHLKERIRCDITANQSNNRNTGVQNATWNCHDADEPGPEQVQRQGDQ